MRHLRLLAAALPVLALSFAGAPAIAFNPEGGPDADGDHWDDGHDQFPCNPLAVSEQFSPALDTFGVILAEDYWPVQLDDDYQDVVVAYNYDYRLSLGPWIEPIIAPSWVVTTSGRFTFDVLAAGGVIDVGLGVTFSLPASTPHRITVTIAGQPETPVQLPGPDLAYAIVPDIRARLFPGSGTIINARASAATIPSAGPIVVTVELYPDQERLDCSTNLCVNLVGPQVFIFRTAAPSHEIHGPTSCGTGNMDTSLFGTGIDNSNPPGGPCYIDTHGLPSMIEVPQIIPYPLEGTNIAELYPLIVPWAASGGTQYEYWMYFPAAGFGYPTPLAPHPLPPPESRYAGCNGLVSPCSQDSDCVGTILNASLACDTSSFFGQGVCVLAACDPGFGDCDGVPLTGCETDVLGDPDNCGACGVRCPSGVCTNGQCN